MPDDVTNAPDDNKGNPSTTQPSEKTVPYDRFKEVNEAKKAAEEKAAALQAEKDAAEAKAKEEAEANKTEAEKQAEAMKVQQEAIDELKKAHENTVTKQQQKLVKSLVKAAASEAGLADPQDAFNFIKFGELEYDEQTESLKGLTEALSALKESKPYLFKAGQATPSGVNPSGASSGPDAAKTKVDLFNRMVGNDNTAFDALIKNSVEGLLNPKK